MPLRLRHLEQSVIELRLLGGAPALGTEVSSTRPFRVSIVEPIGMPRVASRSTNVFVPLSCTFTVPLTSAATTVWFATGVGVGCGVG